MNTSTRSTARTVGVAVRAMALFTVLFGLGYTVVLTVVGQLALPAQANGSLITDADGAPIGSALLGQSFTDAEGAPLPQGSTVTYFTSEGPAAVEPAPTSVPVPEPTQTSQATVPAAPNGTNPSAG